MIAHDPLRSCTATMPLTSSHFQRGNAYFSLFFRTFSVPDEVKQVPVMDLSRTWALIGHILETLGASKLSDLSQDIILGEGLCAGTCIQWLSQFFQTRLSVLPTKGITFFPLEVADSSKVEEATRPFRFLQASYKISSQVHKIFPSLNLTSPEYFSSKLLRAKNMRLGRRLPGGADYPIADLLKQLKNLTGQSKGYLMGISSKNPACQNHAIALHLEGPFCFLDPAFGEGVAETKTDLLLLLAAHLMKNYPDYTSFALLEFLPAASS